MSELERPKIVIPKHSADEEELKAVLKIHYDSDGWVSSDDYKKELRQIIGASQYPSSYPKKAQVPAYFGFLESKLSPNNRIKERRITESGKMMYEAIKDNDLEKRQEILMDALETVIFGRNNAGGANGNSDIEAPDLVIRCILDTGYCTSREYAYMIANMHDQGKNYYDSLDEIVNARNEGSLKNRPSEYADWKPILALIRWGFLETYKDNYVQKVRIHPLVQKRYADRLNKLKVYNVDKNKEISINDLKEIDTNDDTVFKPFVISNENSLKIKSNELKLDAIDVDKQHIFAGDSVLFVDPSISKLLTYNVYLVQKIIKEGSKYRILISKKEMVNSKNEGKLLKKLNEELIASEVSPIVDDILDILKYKNAKENIKKISKNNKDVEPINLVLRALTDLQFINEKELEFLLYSLVIGNYYYSYAIETIKYSRKNNTVLEYKKYKDDELDFKFIDTLVNKKLLEWVESSKERQLRFNKAIDKVYIEQFKRLIVYSVDISKNEFNENKKESSFTIKPILCENEIKEEFHISFNALKEKKISFQKNDYVIFVKNDFMKIYNQYIYQASEVEDNGNEYKLELIRKNRLNLNKEIEILSDLKEMYDGKSR
ncbi:hypothetical protein AAK706_07145 [Erysipelotrichaceae bacterium 66-17]